MNIKKSVRRQAARILAVMAALTMIVATNFATTPAQASSGPKPSVTILGADAAKLTWSKVSGTNITYRVKYSKSSSMSSPKYYPSSSTTTKNNFAPITGLTVNTTYHFQVGVFNANGKQVGSYSAKASGETKNKYVKPTGLAYDNVSSTSVELSWNNVSGAPGYMVRYSSSADGTKHIWNQVENFILQGAQLPKSQWKDPNVPQFAGLRKNTTYKISVAVEQPALGTAGTSGYTPLVRMSGYTKQITIKTSNYAIAAPGNVTISNQKPWSVKVAWDAPANVKAGDCYRVQYALSSKMSGAKSVKICDTSTTLKSLSSNKNYYIRVLVVRGSTQVSDRSAAAIAKTRIPTGTIKGVVTVPDTAHTVALVFTTGGELAAQVDVAKNGTYTATVRPGKYRVKLNYDGTQGYTSAWAKAKTPNGAPVASGATIVNLASAGKTVNAQPVKLIKGASLSGLIRNSKGSGLNSVDLASMTGQTSARQVEQVVYTPTSSKAGSFAVTGLTPGAHWLRFVKSGYTNRSVWINVKSVDGELRVTQFRVSTQTKSTTLPKGASVALCMDHPAYPACK